MADTGDNAGRGFRLGSIGKRPIFNPDRATVVTSNPIKTRYAYVDGKYVPESEAVLPLAEMSSPSLPSVFEMGRTYSGRPFMVVEAAKNLIRMLRLLEVDHRFTLAELEAITEGVVDRNRHLLTADQDYEFQTVVRTIPSARGNMLTPRLSILCLPISFRKFARDYVDGARLMVSPIRRLPANLLDPRIRLLSRSDDLIAAHLARKRGPRIRPLILDWNGCAAQTDSSIFFFVREGVIHVPPEVMTKNIVARNWLLQLAERLSIDVQEGEYGLQDVSDADEAFLANAVEALVPVQRIGRRVSFPTVPGPVTMKLIEAWAKRAGINFVGQALSHLANRNKEAYQQRWEAILTQQSPSAADR